MSADCGAPPPIVTEEWDSIYVAVVTAVGEAFPGLPDPHIGLMRLTPLTAAPSRTLRGPDPPSSVRVEYMISSSGCDAVPDQPPGIGDTLVVYSQAARGDRLPFTLAVRRDWALRHHRDLKRLLDRAGA